MFRCNFLFSLLRLFFFFIVFRYISIFKKEKHGNKQVLHKRLKGVIASFIFLGILSGCGPVFSFLVFLKRVPVN